MFLFLDLFLISLKDLNRVVFGLVTAVGTYTFHSVKISVTYYLTSKNKHEIPKVVFISEP